MNAKVRASSLVALTVATAWTVSAQAETVRFPEGFKWCVSTAAHQIEGDNFNSDLWKWETEKPDRVITRILVPGVPAVAPGGAGAFSTGGDPCPVRSQEEAAAIDPRGDHTVKFPRPDGQVAICEFSGKAANHWAQIEDTDPVRTQDYRTNDVAAIARLGVQQYRMSVEWAKIEPVEGKFDPEAIKHYIRELRLLKERNIEPLVTLFHFSLPQWFREKGGWESPDAPALFARFAHEVYTSFEEAGVHVTTWFTLNEPMVHLAAGYVAGVLPPGKSGDPSALEKPLIGLLSAHAAAFKELHALGGHTVRVGIAHHLRIFDPENVSTTTILGKHVPGPDEILADAADSLWNWTIVDAVETGTLEVTGLFKHEIKDLKWSEDFAGLNYYTRDTIHVGFENKGFVTPLVNPKAVAAGNVNDMGWEIYPDGFERILRKLDTHIRLKGGHKLKIFVSENGIADSKDTKRRKFLEDHFAAMARAMKPNVATGEPAVWVEGYCHWSLTDNFEWNSGYYPQFGFYSVDLETQERTLRPSGDWFSGVVRNNGFTR